MLTGYFSNLMADSSPVKTEVGLAVRVGFSMVSFIKRFSSSDCLS